VPKQDSGWGAVRPARGKAQDTGRPPLERFRCAVHIIRCVFWCVRGQVHRVDDVTGDNYTESRIDKAQDIALAGLAAR